MLRRRFDLAFKTLSDRMIDEKIIASAWGSEYRWIDESLMVEFLS